jgi:hypothetical protein
VKFFKCFFCFERRAFARPGRTSCDDPVESRTSWQEASKWLSASAVAPQFPQFPLCIFPAKRGEQRTGLFLPIPCSDSRTLICERLSFAYLQSTRPQVGRSPGAAVPRRTLGTRILIVQASDSFNNDKRVYLSVSRSVPRPVKAAYRFVISLAMSFVKNAV